VLAHHVQNSGSQRAAEKAGTVASATSARNAERMQVEMQVRLPRLRMQNRFSAHRPGLKAFRLRQFVQMSMKGSGGLLVPAFMALACASLAHGTGNPRAAATVQSASIAISAQRAKTR